MSCFFKIYSSAVLNLPWVLQVH